MGSGDWFKTIISRKKGKHDKLRKLKVTNSEQSNGSKLDDNCSRDSNIFENGDSSKNATVTKLPSEDVAATRIQTAFRAYKARNTLRCLKGMERLRALTQTSFTRRQASTTLGYLQSWNHRQVEISARRLYMVTEGRIKQKKLENQLKVEAKLHDIEADWCGGSDTMEEIIARIQQREEAAAKRERALAYAFSHQWRANSGQNQGKFAYEFGKGDWCWSWMESWIVSRPWECRVPIQSISPSKSQIKPTQKGAKKADPQTLKIFSTVKPTVSNGKGSIKGYPIHATAEKALPLESAAD